MSADTSQSLIYLVTRDAAQTVEFSEQLKLFEFSVHVFTRRSALLAAIHSAPPFAVLVDESWLEDAEFSQVAPLIRKLTNGPIIYFSEPLSIVHKLEMMRAGITDILTKPFDVQQLVDRLDQLMERSHENPFRVLIVDDSEAVSKWTKSILVEAGMQVQVVNNPLEVFLPLERFKPDILLMDVYMPQCTGDEIARVIRQSKQFDSIPIVFLSTETSRSRQLMARSMGGDDFLVKGADTEELLAVVTITAQRYRKLRHWMTRDSLTSLLNHTNLTEQLERMVYHVQHEKIPLAFAMVDIDHFKQVNDNYGHSVGDHVIKSLARMMRKSIRDPDAQGRYGGEEFSIIYNDCSILRAAQHLDSMRQRFAALDLRHGHGIFHATFSAGVVRLEPGMSANQLIDAADNALYRAKRAGRNQVEMGLNPAQPV